MSRPKDYVRHSKCNQQVDNIMHTIEGTSFNVESRCTSDNCSEGNGDISATGASGVVQSHDNIKEMPGREVDHKDFFVG